MAAPQRAKAQALLDLHSGQKLLLLPNVWDPIGARILESKGYPAVATASAAISSSLGFQDGEKITRSTMLEIVSRISRAVDVPVTADMEAGYAVSTTELGDTVRALLDAGAVGMNIEDSLQEGVALRPVDEQAERIAQVREAAAGRGIHLVINARVDVFLTGRFTGPEERIEEAVRRAAAYARAGADCIYPIGPGDVETLTTLRSRITQPLNALATPDAAPLDTMAAIGIQRVSFGPFIFRSCLGKFVDIVDALSRSEGYECFGRGMLSRLETAAYLRAEREGASPGAA
jgi:2-methylisocitrate lyase-like PEP mutase family enzyme